MAAVTRANVETLTVAYVRIADRRQGKHAGATRVVSVRSNGRVQLWKTRPEHFSWPVKYGLRDAFRIGHTNADRFFTTSEEAENGPIYL